MRFAHAVADAFIEALAGRIAKMEAGDPSVSLDLLIRSLLMLGTTRKRIGRILSS